MTEKAPERYDMRCDGTPYCRPDGDFVLFEDHAIILETAQARIQALEDTLNIERALSDGAHRRARAARREALEEAAKVADAETGWIGEPYQSNMDFGPNVGPRIATAIRALMEKPND